MLHIYSNEFVGLVGLADEIARANNLDPQMELGKLNQWRQAKSNNETSSGFGKLRIGEARVYCLAQDLKIPAGLTGKVTLEELEFKAQQRDAQLAEMMAVQSITARAPKNPHDSRDADAYGDSATSYIQEAVTELGQHCKVNQVREYLLALVGKPGSPFCENVWADGQHCPTYYKTTREGESVKVTLTNKNLGPRVSRAKGPKKHT